MKTKSFLSNVLCVLMLCTGSALSGCTEGPIDKGDGTEQEGGNEDNNQDGDNENGGADKGYEDMGTAAYRIDALTATTATVTGYLKVPASELQYFSRVTVYYTSDDDFDFDTAESVSTTSFGPDQDFKLVLSNLQFSTKYKYCILTDVKSGKTYSKVSEFTTVEVNCEVPVISVTATTASFSGKVTGLSENDLSSFVVGVIYSADQDVVSQGGGTELAANEIAPDGSFSVEVSNLKFDNKYFYCTFVKQGEKYLYGTEKELITEVEINCTVTSVTATTASFSGKVTNLSEKELSTVVVGVLYSTEQGAVSQGKGTELAASEIAPDGSFSVEVSNLKFETKYFYCTFVKLGETYSYGTEKELGAEVEINCEVSVTSVTATTASFSGKVTGLSEKDLSSVVVGVLYSTEQDAVSQGKGTKLAATRIAPDGSFTLTGSNLNLGTKYYVSVFVKQNEKSSFSEINEFTTDNVTCDVSVSSVTATTASFSGKVTGLSEKDLSSVVVGVLYSTEQDAVSQGKGTKLAATRIAPDGSFTLTGSNLNLGTKYYVSVFVKQNEKSSFSEINEFTTDNVTCDVSVSSVTATTASFVGKVTGLSDEDRSSVVVGVYFSTEQGDVSQGEGRDLAANEIAPDGSFTLTGSSLDFGTRYYVCAFVAQKEKLLLSEINEFTTDNVTCDVSVSSITAATAYFVGKVTGLSDEDRDDEYRYSLELGIIYSTEKESISQGGGTRLEISDIASDGSFSFSVSGLEFGVRYYYCSYLIRYCGFTYSSPQEFTIPISYSPYKKDLNLFSASGFASPANCYIVSQSGLYKFRTVKGNSTESVGTVAFADVLWESFGTDVAPDYTDLISGVCYKDGYIVFETNSTFREGNALIAAKDADGNILWSWHIWLTDAPQGQTYNNNAGVMMDRNLGATSATPGDVGALGLLYQWGRKDPFLGSSSTSASTVANSTISWPSTVSSSLSKGTVAYATSHPTTFITYNSNNDDWYYSNDSSTDNTRWQSSSKTIYDPCPAGWRVPNEGVWSKALGTSCLSSSYNWNSTNKGMDFSKTEKKLGPSGPIWYPASGYRYSSRWALYDVGSYGHYWSVSPAGQDACGLYFSSRGYVFPDDRYDRACGLAVRCLKE